jgi:Tol biopolymer transport system component/C-terminal processing protease CtpA/Prc
VRAIHLFVVCCALASCLFAQRRAAPQPDQPKAPTRIAPLRSQDGAAGSRYPSITPDGQTVVFSLWGDIWSMPIGGGRATRLTLNEAFDMRPLVTPDGKNVVFCSDRSGSYDLWVMAIDGGTPRRLTFNAAPEVPCAFTADGKQLLFQSAASTDWEIYRISLDGGTETQLTRTGGRDASTIDDGTTLFYIDGASDPKVQEYRGSGNDRLYQQSIGAAPDALHVFDGNTREPRVSKDGKRLYFTREVDGSFELFVWEIGVGEPKQLTKLGDDGLSTFCLSADESTAVFVWKFYLHSLDLKTAGASPKLMPITIREDAMQPRKAQRIFSSGLENADMSFDGRMIAFELNGNIWLMGADGGEARMLTADAFHNQMPRISPDGRQIAFFSERNGNSDIYLMDIDGKNVRPFTTDPALDAFMNWSPDGTRLVYCSERSGNRDIWVQSLAGGQATQLTTNAQADDDPCFSPDGSLIAFDSARGGNADIYVMKADGSEQRRVYGTTEIEESPSFSPDGRMLVFGRVVRGTTSITTSVVVTDMVGSGEATVAEGQYGKFTADGRSIFYVGGTARAGGQLFLAPAPVAVNQGRQIPFLAKFEITEKEEMLRCFDEAAQAYGQGFYDSKYHGKDWDALVGKYRQLVDACGSREEYLYYLNRLVGELSASHSGAYGQTIRARQYNTGMLGLRFTPEVFRNTRQRLRVDEVEAGGPADKAWIRKGDYIFRIAGKTIGANDNAYALLEGTVGQEIALVVSDTAEGETFRELRITPEAPQQKQQREYVQWIMKNKTNTARGSSGQVAYVHIAGMMPPNLQQFQNELASPQVQSCRALIIDVRNNGGGNIHQQLIDILSRKSYAEIRLRNGMRIGQPTLFWDRPIVVMTNESSYSDAEVFPHAIKTLGLGTIVGTPTPGCVIGTNDIRLSDGTTWRIPGSGFYNKDGSNQEHKGCQPDVVVDLTPADEFNGKDPQLDKAVEVAIQKIKDARSKPKIETPTPKPDAPAKEGDFDGEQQDSDKK